jgi:hypothetical protein
MLNLRKIGTERDNIFSGKFSNTKQKTEGINNIKYIQGKD